MSTARKIEPRQNDLVFNLSMYAGNGNDDLYRYGSFWSRAQDGRYFVPEYLSGGDYSGSLVEKSNYNVFLSDFKAGEDVWFFQATGGHGTYAIVIDSHGIPDDVLTEVNEWLSGLYDYPLASEDEHSRLEMEAQDEAWEQWAARDFVKAIEAEHGIEIDSDKVDAGRLYDLFRVACDAAGADWRNESGSGMYIDLQAVAAKTLLPEVKALTSKRKRAAR